MKHLILNLILVLASVTIGKVNADTKGVSQNEKQTQTPKSKEETAATETAETTVPLNAKMQTFLGVIDTAQSAAEIEKAFNAATFSEVEVGVLNREVEKDTYKIKGVRFRKEAESAARAKKSPDGVVGKPSDVRKLNASLQSLQKKRIAVANRKCAETVKHIKRKTDGRIASMRARIQALVSADGELLLPPAMTTRTPPPASVVKIEGLRPALPIVGREVVLQGRGFGSKPGTVALVVWPVSPIRDEHMSFACPVQSWTATTVVVTVPALIESLLDLDVNYYSDMFGSGRIEASARLLVIPEGETVGSFINTSVMIEPSVVAPVLSDLSDEKVIPGQVVILQGGNLRFPSGSLPRVRLELGDKQFNLTPTGMESFEPGFVQFRIPDNIEGFGETSGRLTVTNQFGLSAGKNVTFVPAEEIVEVKTDQSHVSCVLGLTVENPLCVIGRAQDVTRHAWILDNGWAVEDSWLVVRRQGNHSGAHYIHQPEKGGTSAVGVYRVWADAYSAVDVVEHLLIRGPKGTFHENLPRWCAASGDCDTLEK